MEHYEILQVAAVEEALVLLMRRCAVLPEKALSGDALGAKPGAAREPSERIIPKDMRLPRFAKKASQYPFSAPITLSCADTDNASHPVAGAWS